MAKRLERGSVVLEGLLHVRLGGYGHEYGRRTSAWWSRYAQQEVV